MTDVNPINSTGIQQPTPRFGRDLPVGEFKLYLIHMETTEIRQTLGKLTHDDHTQTLGDTKQTCGEYGEKSGVTCKLWMHVGKLTYTVIGSRLQIFSTCLPIFHIMRPRTPEFPGLLITWKRMGDKRELVSQILFQL